MSSPSTLCDGRDLDDVTSESEIADLVLYSRSEELRLRHQDIITTTTTTTTTMDQDLQEVMLKKKAVLLEEYLRNGGMEPRAVEDRIDILNARIEALEAELAQKGKANAARRYIQHAPQSDFNAIDRTIFMQWLNGEEIAPPVLPTAVTPVVAPQPINPVQSTGFQAINMPAAGAQGQTRPRDPSPPPNAIFNKHKRPRISESDRPPCLRCKILKKKCDSLDHCDHCPAQSYENEADFWKVLGCYREKIRGLIVYFCPDYSRSTQRELRTHNGDIKVIKYVLTQSRVSGQKRRRILAVVNEQPEIQNYQPEAWDNLEKRRALGLAVATLNEIPEDEASAAMTTTKYEACWAVLQLLSMDPVYMSATKYNFFELLRLGYGLAAQQPESITLFHQAAGLLRQSVELYLLEGLCARMASGEYEGTPPFYTTDDPTSSTLILVNILDDMNIFLRELENACASRGKLFGHNQLDCFLAILLFSCAKSMLIDAYSFREKYENKTHWRSTDAMKINSAFKVIISVFCWASKSDVIHQPEDDLQASFLRDTLRRIKAMVHHDKWEERGIRGTKEFLLNLGTSSTLDTRYNGFLAQKFSASSASYSNHFPSRVNALVLSPKFPRQSSFGQRDIYSASPPPRPLSATNETTNGFGNRHAESSHARRASEAQRLSSPTPSVESFVFVNDTANPENSARKHGGRKGALDAETSKKAREMRKLGSCWNCWTSRMGCSEGTPCDRCIRAKQESNCFRAPFRTFCKDILPELLKAHYTADTISKYISEHIPRFEGEPAGLDVKWGGEDTLNVPIALFKEETQSQGTGYSIGIEFGQLKVVRERCNAQLTKAAGAETISELKLMDNRGSILSTRLIEVLLGFNQIQSHPLLRDALVVYLAFDSSYRGLSFTQESIAELPEGTSPPSLETLRYQVRWVLQNLAQELLPVLLGDLEKVYRNRDKSFWPIAFAATILVFLCIEQIQALAFEHLDNPFEYVSQVDSGPIARIMQSFHLRYRTHRHDSVGLNPFSDGFSFAEEPGFDTSAKRMVHDLQKIMGSGELLEEKALPLGTESVDEIPERNSGRLVSKFLLSFLDVGET